MVIKSMEVPCLGTVIFSTSLSIPSLIVPIILDAVISTAASNNTVAVIIWLHHRIKTGEVKLGGSDLYLPYYCFNNC